MFAQFFMNDATFYAIPKKGNDLNFVYSVFQTINWEKYDESTGVPSISKSTINSVNIKKTILPEQIQIGSFLAKIDSLVTLHQKKLERLEEVKKGYMQRLF